MNRLRLPMRGSRLWGCIAVYVALHVELAHAGSAATESIFVILNGAPMRVPIAYIPVSERGIYQNNRSSNGLRIQATLPEMTPYAVREDNRPVSDRYKDEVSILISPTHDASKESHQSFFKNYENIWLNNRTKADIRFSLTRFVLRPDTPSPLGDDDVYLNAASESDGTMIFCTSENVPDLTPAEADSARKKRQLIRNPLCSQLFFFPKHSSMMVRISYFRKHLKNWKKIQIEVSNLLESFAHMDK